MLTQIFHERRKDGFKLLQRSRHGDGDGNVDGESNRNGTNRMIELFTSSSIGDESEVNEGG